MGEYGENDEYGLNFQPLKPKGRSTAVAIKDATDKNTVPIITAAARGALADKILEIARENDIKIREDADLADLLARLEIDSPIPTEALMAVAEILSYVYRANGMPDPFGVLAPDEPTTIMNDNDD